MHEQCREQLLRRQQGIDHTKRCLTDVPAPLPPLHRSAPPVTTSTSNPVILVCTAPGGGPWKTCAIELCGQQAPTRRRQLRDGGCTPIPLSCTFGSNGEASCDVTGKVVQGTTYDVVSTAIKADGTRKSTTGPQPAFTLPLYP